MKPAIRVENLSKQYKIGALQQRQDTLREAIAYNLQQLRPGNRESRAEENTIWALKDVSFEVQPGEVLGVIGRNGAGKSTLLKILSRITEPTSGRAEINGRVGSLLEVGTGFHPELTGRENIYLNGAILGMHKQEIDRKFDEIVAFSEIEKFIDTPVKRYSSGMYVRLAFAVAAHLETEILLVDEVLAVGDAEFQKKCLGKMGDVAGEGRTILFVSHNLIALRNLCQRAILLDHGLIEGDDLSSNVIAKYLQMQATKVHDRVWEDPSIAPGNMTAKLRRVWVESNDGPTAGGFARERDIFIGVEHWQFDPSSQIHITLHFKVEGQVVAFTTGSSSSSSWEETSRRPCLLRSICRIPSNFLNTGQYNVSVLIVKNTSRVIYTLEDAISFEIVETAYRPGAWFGKEPGVVRPQFDWEINILELPKEIIE